MTILRACAILVAFSIGLPSAAGAALCAGDGSPPGLVAAPGVEALRGYRLEFRSPTRVAVDDADNVYIADPGRGELVVRRPDGRVLSRRQGLGRVTAVASGAGLTYLADALTGAVTAYAADGRVVARLGRGVGEFLLPTDIAVAGDDGRVYVTDGEAHRVQVYAADGRALFVFGGPGSGEAALSYPSGVFADVEAGEVLVADQFGFRVQIFDREGNWRYCLGGSGASAGSFFQGGRLLAAPQGLWADAAGRIYVADSFEGQVKVLDRGGRLLQRIGQFGQLLGQLRLPMDLAMDRFGRLYVASANNARLEVFGIDGFTDPERYAPALIELEPRRIEQGAGGLLSARLRLPGHRLRDVDLASLTANGVPASAARVEAPVGSVAAVLTASFDLAALGPTLPVAAASPVVVAGRLPSIAFEGTASLEVVPSAVADLDGDGVDEAVDACPGTEAGAVVDQAGCALAQLCRCDGQRNHGRYLSCLARTLRQWRRADLVDADSGRRLLRSAARSDCASPPRQAPQRPRGERPDKPGERPHKARAEHGRGLPGPPAQGEWIWHGLRGDDEPEDERWESAAGRREGRR